MNDHDFGRLIRENLAASNYRSARLERMIYEDYSSKIPKALLKDLGIAIAPKKKDDNDSEKDMPDQ